MKHTYEGEPWKKLVPSSYIWLETVKLSAAPDSVAGAHCVVAVTDDGSPAGSWKVNAPGLGAALQSQIVKEASALGYAAPSTSFTLNVGGTNYTLVPVTKVRAHKRQVARQLGLDTAKAVKDLKIDHLAFCRADGLDSLDVFDGFASGVYACDGFKSKTAPAVEKLPKAISFAGSNDSPAAITERREFCRALAFTRFLQDGPANYINPVRLADIAADMAKENGITCKILDRKAMSDLGMGSMLSVADGGNSEPRTIILEVPGQDNSKSVALVGKGLTFDTGGISIKPSAGMDEMKYDMSGGAAVLGAAMFLSKVKPPVKVICLVGASENMPSATATRPGDVVKAMNGKTIEVLNTDAEGRLVLADVLHYAVANYKPELMLDIATLTGAVLHALGCAGSAVMSNDQDTANYVLKTAESEGEPFWQLPLWPELAQEVKGDVADLRNIAKSNVKAGTIIGGVFLREFVGETKWAHLDIAATGWNCQATGYPRSGGCGFGMRTLIAACRKFGT